MLKTVLFVIALASFGQLTQSLSLGFGYMPENLRKYVQLAQALKYNDECNFEAEEYRQNFTRDKLLSGGIPNMNVILEMANYLVEKDYSLCSAAELYVCDKETQKCVCGDPGYETVKGVNRALYTLEGTNKCRWNTNTYCVSDDQLRSQKQLGFVVDSQCKAGTTCKIGTELCSLPNMMRYIMRTHGFSILFNTRRLTEEMMSGNICACKANQVENDDDNEWENEIDLSNDAESDNSIRNKRSLVDEDFELKMLAKYVSGSAIAI